jgi:hypothetical protein
MALTAAQLKILDERAAINNRANAEGGGGFGAGLAGAINRFRLEKNTTKLTGPVKKPMAPKPKPAPAKPAPAAAPAPSPAAAAIVPQIPAPVLEAAPVAPAPFTQPEPVAAVTQPIADPAAPPVPTLDDAAARVEAATPIDPASLMAEKLPYDPRKKKYGIAATTLTGEGGVKNLGGVATRSLLG